MTEEDWQAWCDSQADEAEPPDPDEEEPDSAAPWEYDLDAIVAECRRITAEEAAGDDDRYDGACDDEVVGAISAWDRIEAHASARKHVAVAELIR